MDPSTYQLNRVDTGATSVAQIENPLAFWLDPLVPIETGKASGAKLINCAGIRAGWKQYNVHGKEMCIFMPPHSFL